MDLANEILRAEVFSVVGAVCVIMYLSPPPAVVIRGARPLLSILGIIAWLGYRVLNRNDSNSESALTLIMMQLNRVTDALTNPFLHWIWMVIQDALAFLLFTSTWRCLYCLFHYSFEEWKSIIVEGIFAWSQANIPIVKNTMKYYQTKTQQDISSLVEKDPNRVITTHLPSEGIDTNKLLKEMQARGETENALWQSGKVSGTVYPAGEEHTRLMQAVYSAFTWANPLHYGLWPTVNQCEAEVICMTANLLHGGYTVVGTTSSGGTESIILTIKAHLEYYGKKRGIAYPELICGSTAHAAVDKACEIMGIRKVCVACDPKLFTLIPSEIENRITSNTIMIYSSAPTYMQGVVDPVEDLSKIALKYDIGLHVDSCLGGFVLPFARKLGYPVPKFDFECPGVTSMSADTHKFAYACKGTSVVLYRHEDLRHAQYFSYSKWTGGLYITPTIAGSRPGALLVCAWAALVSIGESGYMERVKSILTASQSIVDGISKIPGIRVLGAQVPTMIVCFDSAEMDIYRVGGKMTKKGWNLNPMQKPACIHLCVTLNTVPYVDNFIADLRSSVEEVRIEGPSAKDTGNAAIYGMANNVPAGPVNELLRSFTDVTLAP